MDHYSIVREPEGEYESHINPTSGTGFDIAAEIVTTVYITHIFIKMTDLLNMSIPS